ncbi:non-ribosomal peptide synthetase [Nocardia transvalensis]|nr:non-ribosomal peptide synthetase [Nocardia transvalensis]
MRPDIAAAPAYPLSKAQWGWWLAQQLHPAVPVTVALYLDLEGDLDIATLAGCARRAAHEFESPQLRVRLIDGIPHQCVDATAQLPMDIVDLTGTPDPVAAARDRMRRDHTARLDPLTDRLTVAAVFTVAPHRHLLYLRSHHIALDGVGAAAVLRRTAELYRAATAAPGERESAAALGTGNGSAHTGPLSISQILDDEQAYQRSSRAEADRDYWREQLAGAREPVGLAGRVAAPQARPHQVSAALDDDTAQLLARAKAGYGATFPELTIAAFACFLARMTGATDLTLTLPVTARPTAALRRSASSMSNVVPLRLRDLDVTTVGGVVAQVRSTVIGALRHQRHRHEDIRHDHEALRDGFGPVVNVLGFTEPLRVGSLTGSVRLLALGPVTDLHVNGYQVGPDERSVCIDFQANPHCYRFETVVHWHRRFLDYFRSFLAAGRDCPAMALGGTVAVSVPHPTAGPTRLLPDLLCAAAVSDAVAVRDGQRARTYAELDKESSRWARLLLAHGAGPGTFVAVLAPRSLESVLALWAVAKSGACFVPMDPDEPAGRLRAIAANCGARWGLTVRSALPPAPYGDTSGTVPAAIEWFVLDDDTSPADKYPGTPVGDADRPRRLRAEHPAYLIHTSGTTGSPKGVVVGHRGLGPLIDHLLAQYGITANSVLLHSHTSIYDAHLLELLAAFAAGAQLVVAPPTVLAGAELAQLIRRVGCTVLQTAPAVLATMSPDDLPGVEVVAIGGEACPATVVREWAPRVRLYNGYGPTEATIMVTETAAPMTADEPVTIGRPLPGVFAVVLDARLRPVPQGARGELYLGGSCVAQCYLHDPVSTAARFVADPFNRGERLYRTGDLVSANLGGAFEFHGRLDNQIQLHGRRIEPAEIEAALLAQPEIAYATVIVTEAREPSARLAGYVVAASGATLDTGAVLRTLRGILPPSLIPGTLIELARLPLSGNGKIDRAALPAPRPAPRSTRLPQTELERLVADHIATAVGAERVGLDDDFFELGGNSLLGVGVSANLSAATNVPVTVRWLYTTPTVAALAQRIAAYDGHDTGDDALGTLLTLRHNGTRPPLFCVHSAVPLAWCYSGLASYLTDRPIYGLQATELADRAITIDDLVGHYLDTIYAVQPHGPYHLLGWSLGGQLAHALAVRLRADGATVAVLAMLDSVVVPAEAAPPPAPRMRDLLTHLLGDEPEDADAAPEVTAAEAAAELAGTARAFGAGLCADQLERLHRGYVAGTMLSHGYRPGTYDGDLLYFSATRGITALLDARIWRPHVTGKLIEHRIEATHAQLTNSDVVAVIGPLLDRHLTAVAQSPAADSETAPAELEPMERSGRHPAQAAQRSPTERRWRGRL